MADVLVCGYRFVREGKDGLERVVLKPGDKASNLPDSVRKELKENGLVVNEKLLDKNFNRIPGAVVVGAEPETTEVGVTSTPSEPDDETKTPAKKTTSSSGK